MSLRNFICPDGGTIDHRACLKEGGCRMGERCATRPYLMMAASEREQRFRCGSCTHEIKRPATNKEFKIFCPVCQERAFYVPSTTQLIQGTKQAFLKLTTDFDISPDSRAFMVTGTKGHAILESFDDDYSLIEEKFMDEKETGISDLFTTEEGKSTLSDYKVTGSYKVMKALGWCIEEEPTGEIFKNGKRAGQPRTRKIVKRSPEKIDRWEWDMQLNRYRINFEKRGFRVDQMKVQTIVRDGNTFTARSRGVFRNIYYFNITRLPDQFVTEFFDRKREALLKALEQGYWNDVCDAKESWDGLKCAFYCECADSCPMGKYLKREKTKETETMPIQGLSESRRLPRMGKIRLGIMIEKPGGKSYPKEVKHFILDPAVENEIEHKRLVDAFHAKYGQEPTSIDILFPVADIEQIFPQYYKSYGSSTLLNCKGDGETAETNNPEYIKRLEKIGQGDFGTKVKCRGKECPYFKDGSCSPAATLSVLLPELPGSGVWQVTTGSIHSIINLNSCLDYIRILAGRFHMIPLKLERREQEIAHDGKKTKHYVLHVNLELSIGDLQRRALIDPVRAAMELPAPEEEVIDLHLEHNSNINPTVEAPPIDVTPAAAEPEVAWDADPTKEQADLGLKIEFDINEVSRLDDLLKVRDKYTKDIAGDSKNLTVLQKDNLKKLLKKRVEELTPKKQTTV